MRIVRISAGAAREYQRARTWWRANRDKAPTAFDDDFNRLLRRPADRPDLVGSPVAGRIGLRRVELRRMRYYVYFQIVEAGGYVALLAIRHMSRAGAPRL